MLYRIGCLTGWKRECCCAARLLLSGSRRHPVGDGEFLPALWAYQKLCEEYSSRRLRNDGDALRAMAGILRPVAACLESPLVEGMPGYFLDHFVLFVSADGRMRRRPGFASFSWAGWEGRVMWPRENYDSYHRVDGRRAWDVGNVVRWFRRNSLVGWRALTRSGEGVKNWQNLGSGFRRWCETTARPSAPKLIWMSYWRKRKTLVTVMGGYPAPVCPPGRTSMMIRTTRGDDRARRIATIVFPSQYRTWPMGRACLMSWSQLSKIGDRGCVYEIGWLGESSVSSILLCTVGLADLGGVALEVFGKLVSEDRRSSHTLRKTRWN